MSDEKLKIDIRRNKIIRQLDQNGEVCAAELADSLNTSVITIRNDLDALERDGYLERVRGGAVQTTLNCFNRDFLQKKQLNTVAKKKIAKEAVRLIHDGDSIMINSGTTSYFTALELKKHNDLKIVTNSMTVAIELSEIPSFHVILLGGEINLRGSFTYGGDIAAHLKSFSADKAILSIDGICLDSGIGTMHVEEVLTERIMFERAKERIIIADSSKLGRAGFMHVCSISEMDRLITDSGADSGFVQSVRSLGVKVTTAQ